MNALEQLGGSRYWVATLEEVLESVLGAAWYTKRRKMFELSKNS